MDTRLRSMKVQVFVILALAFFFNPSRGGDTSKKEVAIGIQARNGKLPLGFSTATSIQPGKTPPATPVFDNGITNQTTDEEKEAETPASENDSPGFTLELDPLSQDLTFRHKSPGSKGSGKQFAAQIVHMSIAGELYPVLVVQPIPKDPSKLRSEEDITEGPETPDEAESKGKDPQIQATSSDNALPSFSIHMPVETNSQFQIPRLSFTMPVMFLPGLVFSQTENVKRNTHELHVRLPEPGDEYKYLPVWHVSELRHQMKKAKEEMERNESSEDKNEGKAEDESSEVEKPKELEDGEKEDSKEAEDTFETLVAKPEMATWGLEEPVLKPKASELRTAADGSPLQTLPILPENFENSEDGNRTDLAGSVSIAHDVARVTSGASVASSSDASPPSKLKMSPSLPTKAPTLDLSSYKVIQLESNQKSGTTNQGSRVVVLVNNSLPEMHNFFQKFNELKNKNPSQSLVVSSDSLQKTNHSATLPASTLSVIEAISGKDAIVTPIEQYLAGGGAESGEANEFNHLAHHLTNAVMQAIKVRPSPSQSNYVIFMNNATPAVFQISEKYPSAAPAPTFIFGNPDDHLTSDQQQVPAEGSKAPTQEPPVIITLPAAVKPTLSNQPVQESATSLPNKIPDKDVQISSVTPGKQSKSVGESPTVPSPLPDNVPSEERISGNIPQASVQKAPVQEQITRSDSLPPLPYQQLQSPPLEAPVQEVVFQPPSTLPAHVDAVKTPVPTSVTVVPPKQQPSPSGSQSSQPVMPPSGFFSETSLPMSSFQTSLQSLTNPANAVSSFWHKYKEMQESFAKKYLDFQKKIQQQLEAGLLTSTGVLRADLPPLGPEKNQGDTICAIPLNGMCGATCLRLGFRQGSCIDTVPVASCVCPLENAPEYGFQLEYLPDTHEGMTPMPFGLCQPTECSLNCQKSGYLTGFCESSCICGKTFTFGKQ